MRSGAEPPSQRGCLRTPPAPSTPTAPHSPNLVGDGLGLGCGRLRGGSPSAHHLGGKRGGSVRTPGGGHAGAAITRKQRTLAGAADTRGSGRAESSAQTWRGGHVPCGRNHSARRVGGGTGTGNGCGASRKGMERGPSWSVRTEEDKSTAAARDPRWVPSRDQGSCAVGLFPLPGFGVVLPGGGVGRCGRGRGLQGPGRGVVHAPRGWALSCASCLGFRVPSWAGRGVEVVQPAPFRRPGPLRAPRPSLLCWRPGAHTADRMTVMGLEMRGVWVRRVGGSWP